MPVTLTQRRHDVGSISQKSLFARVAAALAGERLGQSDRSRFMAAVA